MNYRMDAILLLANYFFKILMPNLPQTRNNRNYYFQNILLYQYQSKLDFNRRILFILLRSIIYILKVS